MREKKKERPARLMAISSPEVYWPVKNFDELSDVLVDISLKLCGGYIFIKKLIDGENASDWEFTAEVDGGTFLNSGTTTETNKFVHFTIEEQSLFGNIGIYCVIESIKMNEENIIPIALCYIYPLESHWEIHGYIKEIDETLRRSCSELGDYIINNFKLEDDLIEKLRTDDKISELMFGTNNKIKLEIIESRIGKELRKVTIKM